MAIEYLSYLHFMDAGLNNLLLDSECCSLNWSQLQKGNEILFLYLWRGKQEKDGSDCHGDSGCHGMHPAEATYSSCFSLAGFLLTFERAAPPSHGFGTIEVETDGKIGYLT